MARMSNAERTARTRAALLLAAAQVFDRHGYLGASLADIVDAAGTTKGALYFHFPSKEALAAAVVREQYDRWPPAVQRVQEAEPQPLQQLVRLSYEVARAFRDDVVVRAGVRLAAERSVIATELDRPYVGWITQVAALLQQAGDAGDLRPGLDPQRTAYTVVAAFFGLQSVSDSLTGREDVEERVTALWELLGPALERPPAGPVDDG